MLEKNQKWVWNDQFPFMSLVPVFQVVRFPNDVCLVTDGVKNGTCYTA